jgi:Reverse transcriptase (RNA-dependent DNA polymerase)
MQRKDQPTVTRTVVPKVPGAKAPVPKVPAPNAPKARGRPLVAKAPEAKPIGTAAKSEHFLRSTTRGATAGGAAANAARNAVVPAGRVTQKPGQIGVATGNPKQPGSGNTTGNPWTKRGEEQGKLKSHEQAQLTRMEKLAEFCAEGARRGYEAVGVPPDGNCLMVAWLVANLGMGAGPALAYFEGKAGVTHEKPKEVYKREVTKFRKNLAQVFNEEQRAQRENCSGYGITAERYTIEVLLEIFGFAVISEDMTAESAFHTTDHQFYIVLIGDHATLIYNPRTVRMGKVAKEFPWIPIYRETSATITSRCFQEGKVHPEMLCALQEANLWSKDPTTARSELEVRGEWEWKEWTNAFKEPSKTGARLLASATGFYLQPQVAGTKGYFLTPTTSDLKSAMLPQRSLDFWVEAGKQRTLVRFTPHEGHPLLNEWYINELAPEEDQSTCIEEFLDSSMSFWLTPASASHIEKARAEKARASAVKSASSSPSATTTVSPTSDSKSTKAQRKIVKGSSESTQSNTSAGTTRTTPVQLKAADKGETPSSSSGTAMLTPRSETEKGSIPRQPDLSLATPLAAVLVAPQQPIPERATKSPVSKKQLRLNPTRRDTRSCAMTRIDSVDPTRTYLRCDCSWKTAYVRPTDIHKELLEHIAKDHPGWTTNKLRPRLEISDCSACGRVCTTDDEGCTEEHDCVPGIIENRAEILQGQHIDDMNEFCKSIMEQADQAESEDDKANIIARAVPRFLSLWGRPSNHKQQRRRRGREETPQDKMRERLKEGDNTKAVDALSSTEMANPSRAELMAKFPLQVEEKTAMTAARVRRGKPFVFKHEEIMDFLESRKSHTATGTDGKNLIYLKKLMERPGHQGRHVLKFLNEVEATDAWSQPAWLEMTEVKNVNLHKENSFRPVGVGRIFNRIREHVVTTKNKIRLNESVLHGDDHTLRPSGPAVVAGVAQVLMRYDICIEHIDLQNAFNTAKMKTAAAELSRVGLRELADVAEGVSVHRVVTAQHGKFYAEHIPQGSSIGSAAMATIMTKALKNAREADPEGVALLSIADDIHVFAVSQEQATAVRDRAKQDLATEGLTENLKKHQGYQKAAARQEAIRVVGAYVGRQEEVQQKLSAQIHEFEREVVAFGKEVAKMALDENHPIRQTAYRALTTNFLPRLVFIQQNHDIRDTTPLLRETDAVILRVAKDILGLHSTSVGSIEEQLRLPTNKGGFGLASLELTAAYQRLGTIVRIIEQVAEVRDRLIPLASEDPLFEEVPDLVQTVIERLGLSTDSALYTDLQNLIAWNARVISRELQPKELDDMKTIQRRASDRDKELRLQRWRTRVKQEGRFTEEVLDSICEADTGRPLNSITSFRANQVHDYSFMIYVNRRMGNPVLAEEITECLHCKGKMEESMEHGFCCKGLGHNTVHTSVKLATFEALRQIARHVGDGSSSEPSLLPHVRKVPENYNPKGELIHRRGDVAVFNVVQKQQTVIDVRTCAMPTSDRPRAASARSPQRAAEGERNPRAPVDIGEEDKYRFYERTCDFPSSLKLVPFAIDSYGRWGTAFRTFLQEYCKRASAGNTAFYNLLISRARNIIQAAHASAVGRVIHNALYFCISPADMFKLAGSGSSAGPNA